MALSLRWLRLARLRTVWLLIVPFLWFADPTPPSIAIGGVLALAGLALRSWAAGFIVKERELTVTGPYALTRNPLYLGSLFLGIGVTIAGAQWVFVALFAVFFALLYGRTIRVEAGRLEELFGEAYREYAARVPLVIPRIGGPTPPVDDGPGFTMERWRGNREYEAVLGVIVGFGLLAAKMVLP